MNHHESMHPEHLPADIAGIAGELDALAARDRARGPSGLAGRIHRATLPALRRPAECPVVYTFPVSRPARRPALAAAASLAILATVGAVWLAGQRAPAPAAVRAASMTETDIDAWLALAGVSESDAAASIDPLDELAAEADALSRSVADSWTHDELFNSDPTTEGAL